MFCGLDEDQMGKLTQLINKKEILNLISEILN